VLRCVAGGCGRGHRAKTMSDTEEGPGGGFYGLEELLCAAVRVGALPPQVTMAGSDRVGAQEQGTGQQAEQAEAVPPGGCCPDEGGGLCSAPQRQWHRRIELLDAGFCNRVHRVTIVFARRTVQEGEEEEEEGREVVDIVVKEFSALSRARSTEAALATDRLMGGGGSDGAEVSVATSEHGVPVFSSSPSLLFACEHGVVHDYCRDSLELSEASVGSQGSRSTVIAVARAVARLHCTSLSRLLGSMPPPADPPTPMVWVSVDTMLLRLVSHAEHGRLQLPEPEPESERRRRNWSVAEVLRVCERERSLLASQHHPIVVGHGDLKPSNVLGIVHPAGGGISSDHDPRAKAGVPPPSRQAAHISQAVLIDYELAGPNYRGLDLIKLFRNDAGPIDTGTEGPLAVFLTEYRAAVCTLERERALAEGRADEGQQPAVTTSVREYAEQVALTAPGAVAELAAEAAALEAMSWLEASIFFMTVLGK
jgi:thiamine kinase-like enzyme